MTTGFCMRPRNKPEGFEPPYTAYEARFAADDAPLVSAFLGQQDRNRMQPGPPPDFAALLAGPFAPEVIEQGWHDDVPGARTRVAMAYWRDETRFKAWQVQPATRRWIEETGSPHTGRWMEIARVRPQALDTLIADATTNWGLAKLADAVEVTHDHGYWGGTRDRIRLSATDDLANPQGCDVPRPAVRMAGIGQTIDVVMPENVVVARGGPDWSRCQGQEREEFLNSVYPAYVLGGRYLRDNANDSGCYAATLVQETDPAGQEVERNHLIAYFVQLNHLEDWTKSHPTHNEIYARFLTMFQNIGRMPDMNLYHEVSVIPAGDLQAIYTNCLPETGLLRFGSPREPNVGERM
jgi:hypothetical protein